jgi:uncharacterized protein (DUF1330 family)
MPAYIIAELTIKDGSYLEEYRATTVPLIHKHGGRQLVGGAPAAKLEGDRALPDRVVVIEFPSLEHAKAWHDDPDFAPMIALRQAHTVSELLLAEGVE